MFTFIAIIVWLGALGAEENPIGQIIPYPRRPAYNPVPALREQNAQLTALVQILEPYRQLAITQQQRLTEYQQALNEANYLNQNLKLNINQLQTKAEQDRNQILNLQSNLNSLSIELKNCRISARSPAQISPPNVPERGIGQFQQSQKLQEQRVQLQQETQQLQEDFQKIKSALDNSEKQLRLSRQEVEDLRFQLNKKSSVEQIQLSNRIQSLQSEVDRLQRENNALSTAKTASEQQIKEKNRRIEEFQKIEARYQAALDEKGASINKWREQNALLKTQLETAISSNKELRQDMEKLKAECQANKP